MVFPEQVRQVGPGHFMSIDLQRNYFPVGIKDFTSNPIVLVTRDLKCLLLMKFIGSRPYFDKVKDDILDLMTFDPVLGRPRLVIFNLSDEQVKDLIELVYIRVCINRGLKDTLY